MHRRPGFYRACFQALGGRDLDVILSVGEATDPAALGQIPDNFQVERRVDQLAVLAKADAFLTHCGMNSANETIFCQVPAILFPQQGEEAAVADRMEALGLGARLRREAPAAIRKAVETVLGEPRFRENAARVAEKGYQDVTAAAAQLTRMTPEAKMAFRFMAEDIQRDTMRWLEKQSNYLAAAQRRSAEREKKIRPISRGIDVYPDPGELEKLEGE